MTNKTKGGRASLMIKLAKQIIGDEKNTPEGKTNTVTMLLAAIVAMTTPFVNGSSLHVEFGGDGFGLEWNFGSALGPLVCLIVGMLLCVVAVGVSNHLRRKSGKR